jgi:hypothetical protein
MANFDSEAAPLGPALSALQDVIRDQSVLIRSVKDRRADPGPKVVLVRQEGDGAP